MTTFLPPPTKESILELLIDELDGPKKKLSADADTVEHYRVALGIDKSYAELIQGALEGDFAMGMVMFATAFEGLDWTFWGSSGAAEAEILFKYRGVSHSECGTMAASYLMLKCFLNIRLQLETKKKKDK